MFHRNGYNILFANLSDGLKPIAILGMPQRGISKIAGGFNRRNVDSG
jgi:hypothetical protein